MRTPISAIPISRTTPASSSTRSRRSKDHEYLFSLSNSQRHRHKRMNANNSYTTPTRAGTSSYGVEENVDDGFTSYNSYDRVEGGKEGMRNTNTPITNRHSSNPQNMKYPQPEISQPPITLQKKQLRSILYMILICAGGMLLIQAHFAATHPSQEFLDPNSLRMGVDMDLPDWGSNGQYSTGTGITGGVGMGNTMNMGATPMNPQQGGRAHLDSQLATHGQQSLGQGLHVQQTQGQHGNIQTIQAPNTKDHNNARPLPRYVTEGQGDYSDLSTSTTSTSTSKEDNKESSNHIHLDSSGLRPSPGVPHPHQQLHHYQQSDKRKFKPSKNLLRRIETYPHTLDGLHCYLYGGPDDGVGLLDDDSSRRKGTKSRVGGKGSQGKEQKLINDMVYWKDIPSDAKFVSPFYYHIDSENIVWHGENIVDDDVTAHDLLHRMTGATNGRVDGKPIRDSTTKYITFEPDPAGWNNKRLSFETVLTLSMAMGRTLVLPPKGRIPMMNKGDVTDQILSFEDFYHLDSINREFAGVNIITMEEFLKREGMRGYLRGYDLGEDHRNDQVLFPPYNRTNWNTKITSLHEEKKPLWQYLRSIAYSASSWNPNDCMVAFPASLSSSSSSSSTVEENQAIMQLLQDVYSEKDGRPLPTYLDYQGKPTPSNAHPLERLREMMSGRSQLCFYTDDMQDATVVHFPVIAPESPMSSRGNAVADSESNGLHRSRLLTHFYSFLYFEDWRHANWIKRFIRDHLRYNDEIQCAAARIVRALRQYAMVGQFHSMHIRLGDFKAHHQLPNLSLQDIANSLYSTKLPFNSTIFISTDEDPIFFEPLKAQYQLFFMQDFHHLVDGINENFYGMIEQVVAAKGHNFYGTFYSTFSGYICRLRGYYQARDNKRDTQNGRLIDTFYLPDDFREEMQVYKSIQSPFWAREFPTSWRDINKGVKDLTWNSAW